MNRDEIEAALRTLMPNAQQIQVGDIKLSQNEPPLFDFIAELPDGRWLNVMKAEIA